MCTKQVREWLVLLTMEKYVRCFIEHGYVSIAHCQQIITSDLIMLGIDDPTHRQVLLAGVQLLINSPQLFACPEPCELHATSADQDLAEDFLDSWKIEFSTELTPIGTPQHGQDFDFPPRPTTPSPPGSQRRLECQLQANDSYSIHFKANFTCVACPHLQFGELYELDQHIAALKASEDPSAAQHRYGNLFSNAQEATSIILIE